MLKVGVHKLFYFDLLHNNMQQLTVALSINGHLMRGSRKLRHVEGPKILF